MVVKLLKMNNDILQKLVMEDRVSMFFIEKRNQLKFTHGEETHFDKNLYVHTGIMIFFITTKQAYNSWFYTIQFVSIEKVNILFHQELKGSTL